ncbi:hypothetical protein OROMI_029693 [Orobanche minor]
MIMKVSSMEVPQLLPKMKLVLEDEFKKIVQPFGHSIPIYTETEKRGYRATGSASSRLGFFSIFSQNYHENSRRRLSGAVLLLLGSGSSPFFTKLSRKLNSIENFRVLLPKFRLDITHYSRDRGFRGKKFLEVEVDQVVSSIYYMSQDRLSGLAKLSIERDLVKKLDYKSLIGDFASKKASRIVLKN